MALDLSKLSAEAKAEYIKTGEHFASENTLAQAIQTLAALKTYGPKLKQYGFTARNAQRLLDAKTELELSGIQPTDNRDQQKTNNTLLQDAFKRGKSLRKRARAVIEGVRNDVQEIDLKLATDFSAHLNTLLLKTSAAGQKPRPFTIQLQLIHDGLQAPALPQDPNAQDHDALAQIQETLTERDVDLLKADLQAAIAEILLALDKATPSARRTSNAQHLDLVDGIIVELTRLARKSAIAASEALGDPLLAQHFELNKLYNT